MRKLRRDPRASHHSIVTASPGETSPEQLPARFCRSRRADTAATGRRGWLATAEGLAVLESASSERPTQNDVANVAAYLPRTIIVRAPTLPVRLSVTEG